MNKEFHVQNREEMYKTLEKSSIILLFSGQSAHRTADAYHTFFANRNFAYMTGLGQIESENFVFMAEKLADGEVIENIFSLPPDLLLERWNGRRLKNDEIIEKSGIENIYDVDGFKLYLHKLLSTGKYDYVYLDLKKHKLENSDDQAYEIAEFLQKKYPSVTIKIINRQIRKQRTIKKPCEIETMLKAEQITKAGILAMMKASKPNMYEYEYKAKFDHELTSRGVLEPAFSSIISAGANNFCIHYYGYQGIAKAGDLILNDVGAILDGMCTDVSRAWPCDGKFTEMQKKLYNCAYQTSEYLFSIIKPGMPMKDVDRICHEFCAKELVKIGVLDNEANVSKYMWHGGAHHVGWDVHDEVDIDGDIQAGMVFCVDVGIYVEELGIGFRLEDNCFVTENGCINLSADIPRTIEEIESTMMSRS